MQGLEAWAGFVREKVAEEGLCFPVGPVEVGAHDEEGKIKVIGMGGLPLLLPAFFSDLWASSKASANTRLGLYTCFPLTMAQKFIPVLIIRQTQGECLR